MKAHYTVKQFGAIAIPFLGLTAMIAFPAAAHPGAHGSTQMTGQTDAGAKVDTSSPVGTVAAFHAALTKGDTAAAFALMAEDAMIFESGSVENSRTEYASHHLAADAAFSAAVTRTPVSQTHGMQSDVAWVLSVETVTGIYKERAIDSRSVETMLLRQVDGEWRIVHIHWSSANLPSTGP